MRTEKEPTQRRLKQWAGVTCLLVAADQVSKAIVRATLSPGSRLSLLDNVLYITFVPNYRGFSWFVPALPQWARPLFLFVRFSILILIFPVYEFYVQTGRKSQWAQAASISISAGTLGNLLDDLFLPYTTDFIQVFQSSSGNLADLYSYVGVGALLLEIVLQWQRSRPKWQGLRHHWRRAVQVRRAFFTFLWRCLSRKNDPPSPP